MRNRNLGLAYISIGDVEKGLSLLSPDPKDGASETARGFALVRANRSSEAIVAFRHAVEEQPNDSTRQLNLASALFAAGNRTESKRRAETAVQLEPLLEDAYVLLAEIEPHRARYWKQRYQQLVPQRKLP
jgi:Flp pilus assembly protein TadD